MWVTTAAPRPRYAPHMTEPRNDDASEGPPREIVGACQRCGVLFLAGAAGVPAVRQVVHAHEIVCPGGTRAGEAVDPFEALKD